jgi:hypothetical protein
VGGWSGGAWEEEAAGGVAMAGLLLRCLPARSPWHRASRVSGRPGRGRSPAGVDGMGWGEEVAGVAEEEEIGDGVGVGVGWEEQDRGEESGSAPVAWLVGWLVGDFGFSLGFKRFQTPSAGQLKISRAPARIKLIGQTRTHMDR